MLLSDVPSATVSNTKHVNHFLLDSEEYSMEMWPTAIQQLTHFEWDRGVFGRQRATSR